MKIENYKEYLEQEYISNLSLGVLWKDFKTTTTDWGEVKVPIYKRITDTLGSYLVIQIMKTRTRRYKREHPEDFL